LVKDRLTIRGPPKARPPWTIPVTAFVYDNK
jgi:hypothetical protein